MKIHLQWVATGDDPDEGSTICHKGIEMPAIRKVTRIKENTEC